MAVRMPLSQPGRALTCAKVVSIPGRARARVRSPPRAPACPVSHSFTHCYGIIRRTVPYRAVQALEQSRERISSMETQVARANELASSLAAHQQLKAAHLSELDESRRSISLMDQALSVRGPVTAEAGGGELMAERAGWGFGQGLRDGLAVCVCVISNTVTEAPLCVWWEGGAVEGPVIEEGSGGRWLR
jgi:hypothetical protein